MSRYYSGPVSDHFSGERFFDPPRRPTKEPSGAEPLARRSLLARHHGEVAGLGAVALCPPAAAWVDGTRAASPYRACELSPPNRGPQHSARPVWSMRATALRHVGPKRVNDQASPLRTCRRSMSSWFRTRTTIISMSRRCRGLRPLIARALCARQRCDCARVDRRSRPKLMIGTIAQRRPRTAVTPSRRRIGRRVICPTATCRCGPRS